MFLCRREACDWTTQLLRQELTQVSFVFFFVFDCKFIYIVNGVHSRITNHIVRISNQFAFHVLLRFGCVNTFLRVDERAPLVVGNGWEVNLHTRSYKRKLVSFIVLAPVVMGQTSRKRGTNSLKFSDPKHCSQRRDGQRPRKW